MLTIENGKLSWINATSPIQYLDDDDDEVVFDGTCECHIETLSENKKGRYADGRYTECQYSIFVNISSVGEEWNPKLLRFERLHRGVSEIMTVQRVEYNDLTQIVEIWV